MRVLLTAETMGELATYPQMYAHKRGEMANKSGDPRLLTDSDVDALARQFVNSAYADKTYADWPLDRRLDGFLRRKGLFRVVEDGDAYGLLLERVMVMHTAASLNVS
jgi:hypothetical protein